MKLNALLGNYDRPTDRSTDQGTYQWTNGPNNRKTDLISPITVYDLINPAKVHFQRFGQV